MTFAVAFSAGFLVGLIVGLWVGVQIGRDRLIQDEWERMRAKWRHPAGKDRVAE